MPNLYETREYAYYCPKCGQCHFITYGSNEMCLVCNTRMIQSPSKYRLTQSCWSQSNREFKHNQQLLFNEIISKSPEFDIDLYNNKDSILKEQSAESNTMIEHGKAILENRVECPYCHSTSTEKIHYFSWLGMVGKQFHCNNCNANF